MYVINRKGEKEHIRYDNITDRNIELCKDLPDVNPDRLSQLVIQSLKNGMTTSEIDILSAETAFYMSAYEPQYDTLAARIVVSNLHKSTSNKFSDVVELLYHHKNSKTGRASNIINSTFYNFVQSHKEELDNNIDYRRDYNYGYFGFKTLEKSYLLKMEGKVVERPQQMLMRVAVAIHCGKNNTKSSIEKVLKSYDLLSKGLFTHASPTLFNAGSEKEQLSSCFLLTTDDNLEHIYTTQLRCALISKHAGGIGIDITNVRAKGSPIHSTNGVSDGIVPMIQTFNATSRYCNQSGKRKGSFAMYLQPWHADIFDFIVLRYNTPPDEIRARDIFLALWIPDIFMKRVEKDEMWSLFCPSVVPDLTTTYGEVFEEVYIRSEKDKKYTRQVKARELWEEILKAQSETGMPYITYKDAANNKSNQKNIGMIKSSNLCNEILEYADSHSIANCNLASIALPKYQQANGFDYKLLGEVTEQIVENLNNLIDINYYPVEEAKVNNEAYRPIGIGIQGLADLFALNKAPWGSERATILNQVVMEVIYYHALKKSAEMAQRDGSYSKFEGSPASQGTLQYDMWNKVPITSKPNSEIELDWEWLKTEVKKGLRNSLLVACMPTATTAQILGNNESIEPFTSNIYSRSVLSGNFTIVNQHLYKDLKEIGCWTKDIVNQIISNDGSVQAIKEIPDTIKEVYKTVWEIPQKILIDYAADRGAFVCQTQSMNIFMAHPTIARLSSMHLYGWKKGLKTGSYYIRSKPSRNAVKFTIMPPISTNQKEEDDVCINCSA